MPIGDAVWVLLRELATLTLPAVMNLPGVGDTDPMNSSNASILSVRTGLSKGMKMESITADAKPHIKSSLF
jgi:hypothetical protein